MVDNKEKWLWRLVNFACLVAFVIQNHSFVNCHKNVKKAKYIFLTIEISVLTYILINILNRHDDSLQFCPAHQCYQRVPRPHANQYKVNLTE